MLAAVLATLVAPLAIAQPTPRAAPKAGPVDAPSTPPPVTSPAWFDWYAQVLSARLAACPRERSVTLHFSQDGDDVAGSGSVSNPYRTLARAQAAIDAHPEGDLALLFRRGDVWREDLGLSSSVPNVTIADYGLGEKPLFTAFRPVDPGLWQPDPARPGVYILDESATYPLGLTSDIVWVKQDDNRDEPLVRMSNAALVATRPGSWHWNAPAGLLYLHPRLSAGGAPVDPRVEAPFEVARPSGSGVFVRGNGSRVENLVTEGWGLSRTVAATQKSGIEVGASGSEQVVVFGAESYYGPSHAMAHWAFSGSGGVVTFVGCRAGLCNPNGTAGETIFNTYALQGGYDTIFHGCEAAYGTLPSSDWSYGVTRRGRGFYGHAGGGSTAAKMVISFGCTVRGDRTYGCDNPSNFNSNPPATAIENVRCWVVGETFLGGPGCEALVATIANAARVNGRYLNIGIPAGGAGAMQNWSISGWAINCVYDIDARLRTARYAMSNAPSPTSVSRPKFWNCTFMVRTAFNGQPAFSFEFDLHSGDTGAELRNCVIMHEGPGEFRIGLGAPNLVLDSNAYFGLLQTQYALDRHGTTLAAPVPLLEPPPRGSPVMLARRPQATTTDVPLGHDAAYRVLTRKDLGAFDWSAVVGDLSRDGRLDVDDLYHWEQSPVDLTGDNVVDASDRAWLERAVRWDELFDMIGGRRPRPAEPRGLPGRSPRTPGPP